MISLLAFAGALASLSFALGGDAQPFSTASSETAAHMLRGGRRLQGLFCNTIGCPAGYTPIADANFVECSGTCQVSQCCEAFCSYHACPDSYIPIADASTTMCDDSGCTTAMCCAIPEGAGEDDVSANAEYVEDEGNVVDSTGELYCNSLGCPAGYTPIANASMVGCSGDTCEVSQCCEAFCSYHACPDSYVPITDAATTMCDDSGCTTDMCCAQVVSNMFSSTAAPTATPVGGGDDGSANAGYIPYLVDDDNDDGGGMDGSTGGMYCNSIGCPAGYTPIIGASMVECNGDMCDVSQCCEAFCSYHACPDSYVPIDGASTTVCADSGCTTDMCCVSVAMFNTTSNRGGSYGDSTTTATSTTATDDDISTPRGGVGVSPESTTSNTLASGDILPTGASQGSGDSTTFLADDDDQDDSGFGSSYASGGSFTSSPSASPTASPTASPSVP